MLQHQAVKPHLTCLIISISQVSPFLPQGSLLALLLPCWLLFLELLCWVLLISPTSWSAGAHSLVLGSFPFSFNTHSLGDLIQNPQLLLATPKSISLACTSLLN